LMNETAVGCGRQKYPKLLRCAKKDFIPKEKYDT
jgi:hypothetical protein